MTKQTYTFEELRELASKHGIEVKPPAPKPKKPDPGTRELRRAISKRNQKTKTGTSAVPRTHLSKRKTHYVKAGGEQEFVKGEWIARTEKHWEHQAQYGGPAQLLEVGDVDGPTVIQHHVRGQVIARGCAIDGYREVVRPKSPIRVGKLKGTLCIECHRQWEQMTVAQRKDLPRFVTRRLRQEGFIDSSLPEFEVVHHSETHTEQVALVLTTWRTYLWASRVLNSVEPEKQEPGSKPFFYISGPIQVAEEIQR